jgi:hypothetical protein
MGILSRVDVIVYTALINRGRLFCCDGISETDNAMLSDSSQDVPDSSSLKCFGIDSRDYYRYPLA